MTLRPRVLTCAVWLTVTPALPTQSPGFWEFRPRLATARQEVGAAALDGKLYVGGGLLLDTSATATVEVFDPTTRQWSSIAALPTTRHHFGMAAAAGKLYAIGGYVSAFIGDARCYCWDPSSNQWTAIAPLPLPRGALAAVTIDDEIYAVGGTIQGLGAVGDLTRYDPATDQWQTLPSMPTPREHLAAAALDGKLYVAGGRSGLLRDQLECYDPATDQWTTLAPMPTARGGNGAAVLDGKLIVVGGEGSTLPGGNFPQAEEWDPQTNSWRALTDMVVPLHGIYPVTIGEELLVAGGGLVAGFRATDIVLAYRRLPTGVQRYGASTPACSGAILTAPNLPPAENTPAFAVVGSPNAPASAGGALLVSATADAAGTAIAGITLHVGLAPLVIALPAVSDPQGAAAVAVPLPAGTGGVPFFVQFIWANGGGCVLPGPLSASDALAITVQAAGD